MSKQLLRSGLIAITALLSLPAAATAAAPPESLAAIDCSSHAVDSTCFVTIAPGLGILAPRRDVTVHADGLGFDLVGDLEIPTGDEPIGLLGASLVGRVTHPDGPVDSLIGQVLMPMPNGGFLGPVEVTERPIASMGFASGFELLALEGPIADAPLANDRDYFFFNAVARFAAELPPISMETPGGAGVVVLDPTDPFFYVAGEVQGFGGDGQDSKDAQDASDPNSSGDSTQSGTQADSSSSSNSNGAGEGSTSDHTASNGADNGSQDSAEPTKTEQEADSNDATGAAGFAFSLGGFIPFKPAQTNGVEDRMPSFDGHFFLRTSQPLSPLPISATGEFIYDLDPADDVDTPFDPAAFAASPDLAYGINGALDVGIPFLKFFEFGFPLGDASAAIVVDADETRAAFSGRVTDDEFLPGLPIPIRPTGEIQVYGVLAANDLLSSYIHAEGEMGIDASGLGALSGVPLGELYATRSMLDVNAAGLTVQGSTSVGIHPSVKLEGESGFEVFISPAGESRLKIFGNFVVGGERLENAEMVVDRFGVRVNGRFLTGNTVFEMQGEIGASGYLLSGSAALADPIDLNAQKSVAALNAVLGHREVVAGLRHAVDAAQLGVDAASIALSPFQTAVNAAQASVNSVQSSIRSHSTKASAAYSSYKKWKRRSCKWYDAKCKSKRAYYTSKYYARYAYHVSARATLYATRTAANAALALAKSKLTAAQSGLSSARAVLAIAENEMAAGIAALRAAEAELAKYPPIDGALAMIVTIGIENDVVWADVEGDWNGQTLTEGSVQLGDPGEACLLVPTVGPLCSTL